MGCDDDGEFAGSGHVQHEVPNLLPENWIEADLVMKNILFVNLKRKCGSSMGNKIEMF